MPGDSDLRLLPVLGASAPPSIRSRGSGCGSGSRAEASSGYLRRARLRISCQRLKAKGLRASRSSSLQASRRQHLLQADRSLSMASCKVAPPMPDMSRQRLPLPYRHARVDRAFLLGCCLPDAFRLGLPALSQSSPRPRPRPKAASKAMSCKTSSRHPATSPSSIKEGLGIRDPKP